jgi:hypothetical protein
VKAGFVAWKAPGVVGIVPSVVPEMYACPLLFTAIALVLASGKYVAYVKPLPFAFTFATKALPPAALNDDWYEPAVVGKSTELVPPVTYDCFAGVDREDTLEGLQYRLLWRRSMLRNWLPLALLVVIAPVPSWSQSEPVEGRITGTILTEDGQLANDATACLSVRSGVNRATACHFFADKEGRFTIEHLKAGDYQVFAINEAEGYSLDTQAAEQQEVTITPDQLWPNVTIRLRSRGAVLIGSITNKVTGKPVDTASIRYIALDRKHSGSSNVVNGTLRSGVPANCDLIVIVTADGYKGWVYTDPSDPTYPALRVASGERKEVHIELEPLQPVRAQ